MSPEQASGGTVDYRSDIYALGCVAYAMLAGEPPFSGRTAQVIMARQVREQPPSLRVVRPEVPEAVEAAVLAALEKDPVKRPASAGAFAARMEA
jgi:serine/threonine-protein kinase